MKKDTTLINIYLAIHNKRPITLDDLRYLAEYAPDCFEKTCENVIYNIPEAKPVLAPRPPKPPSMDFNPPPPDKENIAKVLANIKRLEAKDYPLPNVEAEDVKNLLGNLYMELLYPHNDKDMFINVMPEDDKPRFDQRA